MSDKHTGLALAPILTLTLTSRLARYSRYSLNSLSIKTKRSTLFSLSFLTVMSAALRCAAIISGALISEAVDTSPATAVRLPIAVLPEVLRPSERRLAPQQLEHPARTARAPWSVLRPVQT